MPGSFYAAFGDKHALFLRALDRYCDGQASGLVASLEQDGPVLPRARDTGELPGDLDPRAAAALLNTVTQGPQTSARPTPATRAFRPP